MTTKRHPLGWNQYSDKDPAERIRKRLDGSQFEYIGGYTERKKPITIRCKACGYEFSRIYEVIFDKRYPGRCPNCIRREREEKAAKKKAEREADALRTKDRKRMDRYFVERRKTKACKMCGRMFRRANGFGGVLKLYCSEECLHIQKERTRRAYNRHRDERLKKCEKNDHTINVPRLYERDGGRCWICGEMTNLEDRIIREDGTVICGNDYPSIDHIIPISRGGNNVWDNVRLAHRKCNSSRGAAMPE